MTCLATGSYPINGARYGFNLVEQDLNTIGKWLVTPVMSAPLLHQWVGLAKTVIIVAHNTHSWIRLMTTFLPLVVCVILFRSTKASQ